jgi:exopolysaccharide biosynthesis polyprenyl glycosylphosphotransferase
MNELTEAISGGWSIHSSGAARRRWTEHTVLAIALAAGFFGDALCVMGILRATFILTHGVGSDAALWSVLPWLYAGLGTAIFTGAFAYNGMYTREVLLDRRKQTTYLIEAWLGSSVVFFGAMSLFGQLQVSFPHALLAAFTLLTTLFGWRVLLQMTMRCEAITGLLRQRVVILGWSESTAELARQTWEDFVYPCEIVGYVEVTLQMDATETPPTLPCLGAKKDLAAVLQHYQIDTVFLAGTNIAADTILELARICQTEMVEFKVIPSCFPALVSGMHVEWVSGVPILGTDRLRMNRLLIRMEKRALDILGAVVGLVLFGPLIGFFALLVYLESPGPVFYRQRRLGLKGMPFEMIKIRSMRLDAEKSGGPGWTVRDDPRRLKVGAFMRRWNIDELPQFWNVLKGEMSLVGPRPERPEFIQNLKHEIMHYNLRHSVKPGLTGWAQVNGFRGDTDLSERIRYDLFYIDNWSALLDVQTMILTIFKHKNAC